METEIKVVNKSMFGLPEYADNGSAGMDIRADIRETVEIRSLERKLIPTGLYIQLPKGFEAQVRPRSGLAIKHGITVLNSPGTIDSSYRGEIGVILINLSKDTFFIEPGDRIAQMVIARHEEAVFKIANVLDTSERDGGFGHTGVK